jgi:general nucleoside transport system permease protein
MTYLSPVLAFAITVVICVGMFVWLGKDPLQGLELFFIHPLSSAKAISELSIKAVPLLLIGLGLALSFRTNVWNIGAEGQFILGAIGAGGVSLLADENTPSAFFVLVLAAGALAGMAWASIVAVLRDRFNASEILVSLMLVYVAEQVLSYLVYGPWKDPKGYNFPQTITFADATSVPRLIDGYRANWGIPIALLCALLLWMFIFRTHSGFRLQVGGHSPLAAKYAGFSARAALWTALLGSGALAGLAGALEVAGPLGQLTTHVPLGYGFAAIIVAFVGRLHPVGVVFAAVLMSMLYIGGELSQSRMGLPKALTAVFQGLLLFVLLACDTLINYRVRFGAKVVDVQRKPSTTKQAEAQA